MADENAKGSQDVEDGARAAQREDRDDKIDSVDKVERTKKRRRTKKMNTTDVDNMRIIDLKEALRDLKLSTSGNKNELKKRLLAAYATQRRDEETEPRDSEQEAADAHADKSTSDEDESSDNEESTDDTDDLKHRSRIRKDDDTRKERRVKSEREAKYRQNRRALDVDLSESDESLERRNDARTRTRRHGTVEREFSRSNFTIKDVEGSLTYFTGDDKLPIKQWISEFEDMSALLKWDDLQKLIYGKRMLKGSAKQFVSFEKEITSWKILKRRLIKEFQIEINSALIHSQLFKRRRQPGESGRQYIYAMQEIAEQGNIEENALIQYIIDGVPDDECNKAVLYSARTVRDLKKQFELYGRIKEKMQRRRPPMKKDNVKDSVVTK